MGQLSGKPSALLVVSDNYLAKQLTESLHIQGYKTVRAPLARDCYSAWSSPERFSLCLIDQHLEDQPGHVLAKYLAENKARNVVLFGNLADAEIRLGLYRAGVNLLLREPEGTADYCSHRGYGNTRGETCIQTRRGSAIPNQNPRERPMAGEGTATRTRSAYGSSGGIDAQ